MSLKRTTVEVAGKTVRVKELSMAAHLRLEELGEKRKPSDLIKECIEPEDLKEIEKIQEEISVREYNTLSEAVYKVNGVLTEKLDPK